METTIPHSSSPSRSPKILFLLVGFFVAAVFIALNVWVYKQATKVSRSSSPQGTLTIPSLNVDPISPRPTSPPTPTPLQGPGTYACDPLGICNLYDNPTGKGCPKTFADSRCLGQCGDKSNWCPK